MLRLSLNQRADFNSNTDAALFHGRANQSMSIFITVTAAAGSCLKKKEGLIVTSGPTRDSERTHLMSRDACRVECGIIPCTVKRFLDREPYNTKPDMSCGELV